MNWKTLGWLLLATSAASAQRVTHRWSFNETGPATSGRVLPDAISAAPAVIRGNGATLENGAIRLPGSSNGNQTPALISAYVDLPNGIISSKTDLTLEIWATVHGNRDWQRLFDFGRTTAGEITGEGTSAPGGTQSTDQFMIAIQRGGNLAQQRFSIRRNGEGELFTDGSVSMALGTQYHFAAIYRSGVGAHAATGGQMIWYRDGTQIGTVDVPVRLSEIRDVNNWLGRSQWANDSNAYISYNEVRLYDWAMAQGEITASRNAGPDKQFPAPSVHPATLTMHHGRKARIDVLANATGEISFPTLAIESQPQHGTAEITADGAILYTHTSGTPESDSFTWRVSNSTGQSSTAVVTISFADTLRLANPAIDVPADPPASTFSLVNAFGSLSFTRPVCIVSPPGDTQRVFVCEKGGLLKVVPDIHAANPSATTFLNLAGLLNDRPQENINTNSEAGLLGLAFHPDYANNRQFYIFYSVNINGLLHQRVSRFTTRADNPNLAYTGPDAELILISQRDNADNHNGGDLHFGPDGYLYISLGDEGGGNDQYNRAQIVNGDFFSGILRIDVDKKPGNIAPTPHSAIPTGPDGAHFSIPIDNPFVHTSLGGSWNGTYNGSSVNQSTIRREFYATGLRNPWRMSFDPLTNELWCADVGQGAREEINIIENGRNYGWSFREGTINGPKSGQAPANFNTLYHTPPIYEYTHGSTTFQGRSVTGGVVYRGDRIGALSGKYIFGDHVSGHIWSLQRNSGSTPPTVERIAGLGGVSAFGVDPFNQDVLLADYNGGRILRLVASDAPGSFPATLTATGLFADLADLSPNPGLLPYSINLPFWSDHALKRRWFMVPDGSSTFSWSRENPWTPPAGALWVKHFDLEMERGDPESKKRIETRLFVKNSTGAYGVSYRWNEDETEAFLVPDEGVNIPLAVTENGNPAPQTWRIPSRAECMTCHTPQAGHALSFNTRQLNLEQSILHFGGNQIDILREHGFFSNTPESPNLLPRHLRPDEDQASMEARVRSYLAVNCAYCHMDGGTASGWDGRPSLQLDDTGIVNGPVNNNGGNPENRLVVPGHPELSVMLHRMATSGGFSRMPPIATNEIDPRNIDLLTAWIEGELANRQTYAQWRTANFDPEDPDGDPGADPDNDGASNHAEFLADTHPRNGGSFLRPHLTAGETLNLSFHLPVNRSFTIHTSEDLATWTPWDIPGNQGLPVAGGLIEFERPLEDESRFFRLEIRDN